MEVALQLKLKVARAQLGASLALFIRDKDSYSVQVLACAACEIVEGLAQLGEARTLSTHILETFPDIDLKEVRRLRNQYWNAFKHLTARDKKTIRDDETLLTKFSDASNDAALFNGWTDYLRLTKRLPVEAQVFQVWWYATNEAHMNPQSDPTPWRSLFPEIASDDRREQKRRLRRAVEKFRRNDALVADSRTEALPLVISAL